MSILAVSSYSFHRLVKAGTHRLDDAPALAREAGADAIEFAMGGTLGPGPDMQNAVRLRDASVAAGMPITSVCVAAELLRGSDSERRDALDSVIGQLEAAHRMGAQRFRHDATLGPEDGDLSGAAFDQALPILALACREVARRAGDLGMKSSVENHGRFVQHANRMLRLVEAVDDPAFGVTLDVGNSLFAPQDPVVAAAMLAPFAINVHLKDFVINPRLKPEVPASFEPFIWRTYEGGPEVMGAALGEGDLNLEGSVRAILASGYQGPCVVEFEGPEPDPRVAARQGVEAARRLLARK